MAQIELKQAVHFLQQKMKNGTPINTLVSLSNGITAILNSWNKKHEEGFRSLIIKITFPAKTFDGQGQKPCYFIVKQDGKYPDKYLYKGWPRFLDPLFENFNDPNALDPVNIRVDQALIKLAEQMGISA